MNKILNELKVKYQLSNFRKDELQKKLKDSGFYFNFVLNLSEVVMNEPQYLACFYNKLNIIKKEIQNNKIEEATARNFYMCYREKQLLDSINTVLKYDEEQIKDIRKQYAIRYVFSSYSITRNEKYHEVAKRNYFLFNYFCNVLNKEKGFYLVELEKNRNFSSMVNYLLTEYPASFDERHLYFMKQIIETATPKFYSLSESIKYLISKKIALRRIEHLRNSKKYDIDSHIVKRK